MLLLFTIVGNQENSRGNPIAYYRTTQRAKWLDPGAKRYEAWKRYVQNEMVSQCESAPGRGVLAPMLRRLAAGLKPIGPEMVKRRAKIQCDIKIRWASDAHADPDNVLKGINDALFENDKFVACSVDFAEAIAAPGQVAVSILLPS